MQHKESYEIKLPKFEGPFDLLLFFIERDEVDIYDIPIAKITNEFLIYIRLQTETNMELSSEFILFAATLMQIKAKTLIPRKELDEHGQEVDPRLELVNKLIEYRKYKAAAAELASKEAVRIQMIKRGNLLSELQQINEQAGEGTEINSLSLFQLTKALERVLLRFKERKEQPEHIVVRYNYTINETKEWILSTMRVERKMSFSKIFDGAENRIHAIFIFLSMLELIQQEFLSILIGEGRNNFIVEQAV